MFSELEKLGLTEVRETVAGVAFKGALEDAMRVCLWSRFASRVLMQLSSFKCHDDLDLYMGVSGIAFEDYFDSTQTIAVEFRGTNSKIVNTQYGALKVKDAVCDRLLKLQGARPDVDRDNPQVLIYANLSHGEAKVGIDLSLKPLFMREYQRVTGSAPLKENLAAAMIARAGYTEGNFVDPMCGSGTLLLEAAAVVTDTAPGLKRSHYGFFNLKVFDQEAWDRLYQEAKERSEQGIQKAFSEGVCLYGFDADARMTEAARDNAQKAGFAGLIKTETRDIARMVNPFSNDLPVTIVTNPPYGERMGNFNELIALYSLLGSKVKQNFKGARLAVISSSEDLLSCLRLKAAKSFTLYNGALQCSLRLFDISKEPTDGAQSAQAENTSFVNRLQKNIRAVRKWAVSADTDAYRIYDADIPEFNAALDCYGDYCVLQEYQAPSSVPQGLARRRLLDMIEGSMQVLQLKGDNLIVKSRARQKGLAQYEKSEDSAHRSLVVHEKDLLFKVNLDDYLDTGLFLDARPVREKIRELAEGKSFLNLFAYTCTASVAAAKGGAVSTLSVDMSRTYLQWGMENFDLNHLDTQGSHEFIQADCLSFLSRDFERTFDLIYIDPPTFSNSKRMSQTFEVERDQVALLSNLTRFLSDTGTVIFCTNKRGFKLRAEELASYGFTAEDISAATIPFDFSRDDKIHACFLLHFDRKQLTEEIKPIVADAAPAKWNKVMNYSSAEAEPQAGHAGNAGFKGSGFDAEPEEEAVEQRVWGGARHNTYEDTLRRQERRDEQERDFGRREFRQDDRRASRSGRGERGRDSGSERRAPEGRRSFVKGPRAPFDGSGSRRKVAFGAEAFGQNAPVTDKAPAERPLARQNRKDRADSSFDRRELKGRDFRRERYQAVTSQERGPRAERSFRQDRESGQGRGSFGPQGGRRERTERFDRSERRERPGFRREDRRSDRPRREETPRQVRVWGPEGIKHDLDD